MGQEIINVEGMSCDHCKNAVESALAKMNGVSAAEVDLEKDKYVLIIMKKKFNFLT